MSNVKYRNCNNWRLQWTNTNSCMFQTIIAFILSLVYIYSFRSLVLCLKICINNLGAHLHGDPIDFEKRKSNLKIITPKLIVVDNVMPTLFLRKEQSVYRGWSSFVSTEIILSIMMIDFKIKNSKSILECLRPERTTKSQSLDVLLELD